MDIEAVIFKPSFLLDTGPLSILCGFPVRETPYLHLVMRHATFLLTNHVKDEIQGAGKMARVITPLLKNQRLTYVSTPSIPAIVDRAYGTVLGAGERSIIKVALQTGLTPVLDDKDAFIAACRFGLQPIGFQDMIVQLANRYTLPKQQALEIVTVTARQFPAMYLAHTLDLLGQV
jgi:predicted nucleic acid-binding protein